MRRAILLLAAMAAAMVLASGVALAVTKQCKTYDAFTNKGICYGTNERDTLRGTDGVNVMYAKAGGDRLYGFGSQDRMHGQGDNDRLFGGADDDQLYPGRGRDALGGSDGHDFYHFYTNRWGKDTITDTAVSDNDPGTGNGVKLGVGDASLTIDLNSGPVPEVKNASGTSTVNWDGNVIDNATNDGSGNDQITGNDVANRIMSLNGDDIVLAREGDDLIYVDDGYGGDTVNCGENVGGDATSLDNDTVHYDNPGIYNGTSDVVTNCETLNP
jgi:Ca2+-binding RTX toxin-like protein